MEASQYNLIPVLASRLDPHMLFQLLHEIEIQDIDLQGDLRLAKIETLRKTSMIDYAIDLLKEMNWEEEKQKFNQRREEVIADLTNWSQRSKRIIELLSNKDIIKMLRSDRAQNIKYLQEEHNVQDEDILALFKYAKISYEIGRYDDAAGFLSHFRNLTLSNSQRFSAQMGLVACKLLLYQYDDAKDELDKLRDLLDQPTGDNYKMQVQRRSWLLHWSLFVFFEKEQSLPDLVELFLSERSVQTLCMDCPHLLRYLAVAVIISKRKRSQIMKELIKLISQEQYQYTDPITRFVERIYIDYDFEQAQAMLQECERVLEIDPFIRAYRQQFVENARQVIFETYCKLHTRISLNSLATSLNMEYAEAEKWIANLIQQVRLDAKIDSSSGYVVMGVQAVSVNDNIMDRTKALAMRSVSLAASTAQYQSSKMQANAQ